MRCFTWSGGNVVPGIGLKADERLGQVVFLGEEGRGRRYEKVALDRRAPAEMANGRVLEAHPRKVTLPAKDGKPEKTFYVLQAPTHCNESVLIRVDTSWCYTKGTTGAWSTLAGTPETLIMGYGAHGDAGRIGSWDDGLVVMKPGDILRVRPEGGHKTKPYVLWIEHGAPTTATQQDYEVMQVVASAEEVIEDAPSASQTAIAMRFGAMAAFTFKSGTLTEGVELGNGAAGPSLLLGEEGRGRMRIEVPVIGDSPSKITTTGVADLGKGLVGLVHADKIEPNAVLLRVNTDGGYTRRGDGTFEVWKGTPAVLTKGYGADGDAGRIGSWDDALIVLREGDALYARPSGGGQGYALFVLGGKLRVEPWIAWKLKDGKQDPAFYVEKGTAPAGHVPAEWIGRIVTVKRVQREDSERWSLNTGVTGELVRLVGTSVVLNLGWDGRDHHEQTASGDWVCLEADKVVRRLEGEEAQTRREIRSSAEVLRSQAIAATQLSCFGLAEADLRHEVQSLTTDPNFDVMATTGYDSLTYWVERARAVMERFATAEPDLKVLEQRQGSGEVLVDFGGHFRVMGATGNAQYWVIRPDGSEREPDDISYRRRYTEEGDKTWRTVQPDELAISWWKSCTAAEHVFKVDKPPVNGCTPEQLATVDRIEREIDERFKGSTGISGTLSPTIGNGWGLVQRTNTPEVVVSATPEDDNRPADLSKLSALFGGAVRVRP